MSELSPLGTARGDVIPGTNVTDTLLIGNISEA
jgi:hypothetical protein